jgi:hypothetical protein
MKTSTLLVLGLSALFFMNISNMRAQAFRKGNLIVSISEGSTRATYKTTNIASETPYTYRTQEIDGTRDPLILEYAVGQRWGIGFTSGADIFNVNPKQFYGFDVPDETVKAMTSELTFDLNWHAFINDRLDLSVFGSVGAFSMNMHGNQSDINYDYTASGGILRVGTRARYYFWRRVGVMGMWSNYVASASPQQACKADANVNTVGQNYSTSLNGGAYEIGLCYRFLKRERMKK